MKYGDVVLLVIGKVEVPAFVLQSLVHPITDKEGNFLKDAEGNFSSPTEHLTVAYPDPGKGVEIMSGEQVQGAIKFLFSVTPAKTGQHIGFRSLSSPVGISDLAKLPSEPVPFLLQEKPAETDVIAELDNAGPPAEEEVIPEEETPASD